jgi:hypothetical protein
MPLTTLDAASAEARAVYDDIIATRKTDRINDFCKALANHPPTVRGTWESIKPVIAPGEAMRGELLAVVGMADAYQVPVDERFRNPA